MSANAAVRFPSTGTRGDPRITTWPKGAVTASASRMTSLCPTASTVIPAMAPPVMSFTCARTSSGVPPAVCGIPHRSASARRAGTGSTPITRQPRRANPCAARLPTAPSPKTTTQGAPLISARMIEVIATPAIREAAA